MTKLLSRILRLRIAFGLGMLCALSASAQLDTCDRSLDFHTPTSDWSVCGATITPADSLWAQPMKLVDPIVMVHGSNVRHVVIYRYTSPKGCAPIYRPGGERCP